LAFTLSVFIFFIGVELTAVVSYHGSVPNLL
jgi:hypothetical protein